jgi:hypothetical protein
MRVGEEEHENPAGPGARLAMLCLNRLHLIGSFACDSCAPMNRT